MQGSSVKSSPFHTANKTVKVNLTQQIENLGVFVTNARSDNALGPVFGIRSNSPTKQALLDRFTSIVSRNPLENMSVPSPYVHRNSPAEMKEDCRDYLRTGRCKYGGSCKYNHPPNVQTGGGMKMPLDPSEPLFPIRPNEPVCQYYMKHGTCKFGQTCKFHHPPQSQPVLNGNTILSGGSRPNESPQVQWSSQGGDSNVQLLPQRPGEPNCIFFLKNGRCKYGSTCRYHHPLNYHERRSNNLQADDGRRQHPQIQSQGSNDNMPKIRYVAQLPPGSYQQGHFVVTDGNVAFLAMDGSTPAQVIPISQSNADGILYSASGNRPLGHSRDVAASNSTPSIASSYETAMSNIDLMSSHGDSSTSLWNRPRRNNSSNSLGAYNVPESGRQHLIQGGRPVYVQNVGDPSMPLPRVGSTSSNASEGGSVYFDASQGPSRTTSSQYIQVSSGTAWRGRRSNSFDHVGPSTSSHHNRDDEYFDGSGQFRTHDVQRSPMVRGRPPSGGRRRPQQAGEVDDGLSMMTSALLTMLDTPEEAAGEQYDGYYDEQSLHSSQMSTPQMRPIDFSINQHDDSSPNTPGDARLYHSAQYQPSTSYYNPSEAGDDRVLGIMISDDTRNRFNSQYDLSNQLHKRHTNENSFSHWQDSGHIGRPLQENAQSISVVRSQPGSNSPHGTSTVGLYLP